MLMLDRSDKIAARELGEGDRLLSGNRRYTSLAATAKTAGEIEAEKWALAQQLSSQGFIAKTQAEAAQNIALTQAIGGGMSQAMASLPSIVGMFQKDRVGKLNLGYMPQVQKSEVGSGTVLIILALIGGGIYLATRGKTA